MRVERKKRSGKSKARQRKKGQEKIPGNKAAEKTTPCRTAIHTPLTLALPHLPCAYQPTARASVPKAPAYSVPPCTAFMSAVWAYRP